MERRFTVLAGSRRQALIALALALATPAMASPRRGEAKIQFDKGVAAYTKGDFALAAEALGRSFALHADAETLFAWAQAERRLDHCDKALELYTKLLKFDMPPANREAVATQMGECKDALAAKQKQKEQDKEKATEPPPPPLPTPDPPPESHPTVSIDTPPPPPPPPAPEGHWYQDPVGDSLLVLGVGGLATGGAFLMSARGAISDRDRATTYGQYEDLDAKATSRGQIGVGAMIGGGVLLVTSLAWYATHGSQSSTAVSAWLTPGSQGLALGGRF